MAKPNRLVHVDALRGIALFGILLANIPFDPASAISTSSDRILKFLFHLLIDRKLITVFSMMFGFGFYMQLEKAQAEGRKFQKYFLIRMALLFFIGCVHAYGLWFGDIIRTYALGGIFMLLVYHWPVKRLLWLAVFFNVILTGVIFIGNAAFGWQAYNYDPALATELPVAESYGHYLYLNFRIDPWRNFMQDMPLALSFTFGNMLIGMILARKGFFQVTLAMAGFKRIMVLLGFTLGLAGSYVFYLLQEGKIEMDLSMAWLPFVLLLCMLTQSLGYISLFLLLFAKKNLQPLLTQFSPLGQMALTNYIMQSVLYLLVFFHCTGLMGLFGRTSLTTTFSIGLGYFLLQAWISRRYLRIMPQGPVEKCWRSLTRRLTASAAAD